MSKFLDRPTRPFEVDPAASVADVVRRMGGTAFQGKNLSHAVEAWTTMIEDRVTIFMGLAGAMVPSGMGRLIAYCIEHRLIDVLVSTGANLFHDLHETFGRHHYQGSALVHDNDLRAEGVDRMYDVFASEKEFQMADRYVIEFAAGLDGSRPYTTREFLYRLGCRLDGEAKTRGIVVTAAQARVPLYVPALGDSAYGIALASDPRTREMTLDVLRDVWETARVVIESPATAVIYVGGGTPKNFIQQTVLTASTPTKIYEGHRYAVQFVTDAPHWGGLSGCTFEEAQSWGKIARGARMVTCHVDATIALPIVVTAVMQRVAATLPKRPKPRFGLERRDLSIEW